MNVESVLSPDVPTNHEPFRDRDEVVRYVQDQVAQAVQTHLPTRRVPWATTGPVGRDSAGYSVLKAAAYALGYVGPEQAKEEIHFHQQLRDVYRTYGFVPQCGAQSFLVPWATAHLPAFEPHAERLRNDLRAKMTVDADRFDPHEADWIARKLGLRTKALGTTDEASGGALVPLAMKGELIDLQRAQEAFASAGAREIALPPNGRLQFPRLTGGATAYWIGEGNTLTESEPTFGNLDLQAKKLGILVKVNNELLRYASPSAEGLLRMDMARTAARKADLAMLEGTGGTQIRGLLSYSDINSHTAATVGTNGNTFQAQDVALMEAKLPDAVPNATAWVMRKAMHAAILNRRADAVSAADGKGTFLFPARSIADGPSMDLYGTPVVRTAQVANNRSKGSASNLTYILLGYFPDWITARMGVMEFLASGLGDSALQNDQTHLRGIQHLDAGPRNPASFVVCDQLILQ